MDKKHDTVSYQIRPFMIHLVEHFRTLFGMLNVVAFFGLCVDPVLRDEHLPASVKDCWRPSCFLRFFSVTKCLCLTRDYVCSTAFRLISITAKTHASILPEVR